MTDTILIPRCYDSHAHWYLTGEWGARWRLDELKSPSQILEWKIPSSAYRGDWILGFGWKCDGVGKAILDRRWPDQPVALTRVDGHALWVNSAALMKAGMAGASQNGLLVDAAMAPVDQIIPEVSTTEKKNFLESAQWEFLRGGFTHVREMTFNAELWHLARQLEDQALLNLAVDCCFFSDGKWGFQKAVSDALNAKKDFSKHLRVGAVKLFFDGALGSEGAWISEPYRSGSGSGFQLMTKKELSEALHEIWSHGLEAAVHAIGDQAAHVVVQVAQSLYAQGVKGKLCLEHAELLRPETLRLMREMDVICHMQPCHWLSDHLWFDQKIPNLKQHAFRWADLEEMNIKMCFGSDSPIEPPSVLRNEMAFADSAQKGIKPLLKSWSNYHSHPDSQWFSNSFTEIRGQDIVRVEFDGKPIKKIPN